MSKDFCIWNRELNSVKFPSGSESPATYDQMISGGWVPMAKGEVTIVFVKEVKACNSANEVHTDTEQ